MGHDDSCDCTPPSGAAIQAILDLDTATQLSITCSVAFAKTQMLGRVSTRKQEILYRSPEATDVGWQSQVLLAEITGKCPSKSHRLPTERAHTHRCIHTPNVLEQLKICDVLQGGQLWLGLAMCWFAATLFRTGSGACMCACRCTKKCSIQT